MSKTATEPPPRAQAKGTPFSCHAPAAGAVTVAGTFNNWDPAATSLKRDSTGTWMTTLDLPPGRHEYKFVVDGEWCCEPGCVTAYHGCAKCVPNPSGTMNRVVEVTGS